jgi:hypothetical protein
MTPQRAKDMSGTSDRPSIPAVSKPMSWFLFNCSICATVCSIVRLASSSFRLSNLLRKHQVHLRAKLPVRAGIGVDDILVAADLRVHRQFADVESVTDANAQRHGPLLSDSSPRVTTVHIVLGCHHPSGECKSRQPGAEPRNAASA